MEALSEIWPFAPEHQKFIAISIAIILALYTFLIVIFSLRQGVPIHKVILGLVPKIKTQNKVEKYAIISLIIISWIGIFILIIDIMVNGIHFFDLQEFHRNIQKIEEQGGLF